MSSIAQPGCRVEVLGELICRHVVPCQQRGPGYGFTPRPPSAALPPGATRTVCATTVARQTLAAAETVPTPL